MAAAGFTNKGVTIETKRKGDGKTFPKKEDMVTVHYTGTLKESGRKFDSSHDKGKPFRFKIGKRQVTDSLMITLEGESLGDSYQSYADVL